MNAKQSQLLDLFGALCNGDLEPEQADRLTEILGSDADARQLYLDYLDVHLTLVSQTMRDGAAMLEPESGSSPRQETEEVCASVAPRLSEGKRLLFFPTLASVALSMAAMLLVAVTAGWLGLFGRVLHPGDKIVANSSDVLISEKVSPTLPLSEATKPLYVAQVSNLTADVSWGKTAASQEFLLRVRRGDHIDIASGLVQIEYYSGATIILKGPCRFVPTGENSGRLEHGHLTGNVSKGNFVLTTPTAKVIDLGTEFGVSVDSFAHTDVCVFNGEVRVLGGMHGDDDSTSLLLSDGMSARVGSSGQIAEPGDFDASHFARKLPESQWDARDPDEICLVDLLSGSITGPRRLAGVIAPDTGETDRHPWLREDGPGYSVAAGYQSTSWHPFIDGVFIPSDSGQETLIDSSGHRVDLPPSTGRTWGPIWSRRRIPGAPPINSQEDYWGTDTLEGVIARLLQCEAGMIGIHSNAGVTFDLAAVRSHLQAIPYGFRGTLSNLDNSLKRLPEWSKRTRLTADVRVYVDGQLRASRLDFGRSDGELEVYVELAEDDRYLTIVCTDAGADAVSGPDAYDHVVIIDPVLEMTRKPLDAPQTN
jgi:hypothetical protein